MARTYPSYNIYKDVRDQYRWTYEASNGRTIAVSSEAYVAHADCVRSVEIMKSSYASPVYDSTKSYA